MAKVHIHYNISGDDWLEVELEDDETAEEALQELRPTPYNIEYQALEIMSEKDWGKRKR